MIPRIIHQIWISGSLAGPRGDIEMPPRFRASQSSWQAHHPGWTYILWDEQKVRDLVREHYPSLWDLFQRYPEWIQRVDASRYMILHHYGGIYSDLDVVCRRPFDDWLDRKVVLPPTEPFGLANDLMLAEPRHAFTRQLVDNLEAAFVRWQRWFVPRHFRVLLTTGPLYVTFQHRRFPRRDEITLLQPAEYGAGGHADAYVAHIPGNSWAGGDTQAFLLVHRWWRWIVAAATAGVAAAALLLLR